MESKIVSADGDILDPAHVDIHLLSYRFNRKIRIAIQVSYRTLLSCFCISIDCDNLHAASVAPFPVFPLEKDSELDDDVL